MELQISTIYLRQPKKGLCQRRRQLMASLQCPMAIYTTTKLRVSSRKWGGPPGLVKAALQRQRRGKAYWIMRRSWRASLTTNSLAVSLVERLSEMVPKYGANRSRLVSQHRCHHICLSELLGRRSPGRRTGMDFHCHGHLRNILPNLYPPCSSKLS